MECLLVSKLRYLTGRSLTFVASGSSPNIEANMTQKTGGDMPSANSNVFRFNEVVGRNTVIAIDFVIFKSSRHYF